MVLKDWYVPLKSEILSITFSSVLLGLMFSIFGFRFGIFEISWSSLFFKTSLFVFSLLFMKLYVMKIVGYFQGSKVYVENSSLNLGASLLIFVFSLGFLIFPQVWRITRKNLPHKFIGNTTNA